MEFLIELLNNLSSYIWLFFAQFWWVMAVPFGIASLVTWHSEGLAKKIISYCSLRKPFGFMLFMLGIFLSGFFAWQSEHDIRNMLEQRISVNPFQVENIRINPDTKGFDPKKDKGSFFIDFDLVNKSSETKEIHEIVMLIYKDGVSVGRDYPRITNSNLPFKLSPNEKRNMEFWGRKDMPYFSAEGVFEVYVGIKSNVSLDVKPLIKYDSTLGNFSYFAGHPDIFDEQKLETKGR